MGQVHDEQGSGAGGDEVVTGLPLAVSLEILQSTFYQEIGSRQPLLGVLAEPLHLLYLAPKVFQAVVHFLLDHGISLSSNLVKHRQNRVRVCVSHLKQFSP